MMRERLVIFLLLLPGYVFSAEDDLSTLLTDAKNEVNAENVKEEKLAKEIADSKPNKDDAFQWVQKFLVGFPRSVVTSKAGKVLEKIGKAFLKQHTKMTTEEAFQLLENVRPLGMLGKLAKTDDTDLDGSELSDMATCPYQQINCKGQKNAPYRTIDGSCNNLRNPTYGKAFSPLVRFLPPTYADGISAPRNAADGTTLPSARQVSSTFSTEKTATEDSLSTYILMSWGQFLDHDLSLTAVTKLQVKAKNGAMSVDVKCGDSGCDDSVEGCFPIPIPEDDPTFKGKECLTFVRSQGVPNRQCSIGPRQHINQITSYLDGSGVYGSTKKESDFLRDLSDALRGRLKTSKHPFDPKLKPLLPQADNKQCKGTTDQMKCFKAGDARANESPHLTSAHTIMVREHNRIEEKLHQINPHWNGEKLFQETRKIIGAILQRVTYKEYLPAIFSKQELKEYGILLKDKGFYKGYEDTVDAGIANVFATAAFRFGHSMIPSVIHRPTQSFPENEEGDLLLSETLFRPSALYNISAGGVDGFVRGLASQKCTENDRYFSNQISEHLFTSNPPHGLGTDLYSLNIQRGRDHGLPGFNAWREFCSLEPLKSEPFDKSIMHKKDFRILEKLYKSVDDIDVFPAGLAEKPAHKKSLLGATFSCILGRQFRNLRKGDRYWHEKPGKTGFNKSQLQEIRKMTLAKLFCTNSDDVQRLQAEMMRVVHPLKNPLVDCGSLPDIDFSKWKNDEQ